MSAFGAASAAVPTLSRLDGTGAAILAGDGAGMLHECGIQRASIVGDGLHAGHKLQMAALAVLARLDGSLRTPANQGMVGVGPIV